MFIDKTCNALAVDVIMAVGLRSSEIANSPSKFVRMLYQMTTGGDTFDEKINKFNHTINAGHHMSGRFTKELGALSTARSQM